MPSDELEVQGAGTTLSQERPDEYMRELQEQIQAAQVHLKALIDEHAPTVTVTAVTAVPMNGLMRAKVMATAQRQRAYEQGEDFDFEAYMDRTYGSEEARAKWQELYEKAAALGDEGQLLRHISRFVARRTVGAMPLRHDTPAHPLHSRLLCDNKP